MYEAYVTYVDDDYVDDHEYDDYTDDDTDNDTGDDTDDYNCTSVIGNCFKLPKASFKWVPNLGTSSSDRPIIDRSYGAPILFGG